MREVIKNIEVKGSTMGSQKELEEATDFLAKHKIVPVIGKLIDGLENADEGFVAIQHASHIGKIVLRIRGFNEEPQKPAASSSSPKL
ncbi:hypothetical protein FRC02_001888 [Tulasnella sp. 418]|nr:hypothetical protein FRC02_001888 [Tulasnella sp. 418]